MYGGEISGCFSIGGQPLYSFLSRIISVLVGGGLFAGCVGKNVGMLGRGGGVGVMY